MDAEVQRVREFFSERYITLKHEWEAEAIRYVKLNVRKVNENIQSYNLETLVFEQWLYSDLRESTHPTLKVKSVAKKLTIINPHPVQLESIINISDSFYAQYRSKVTDLTKDDDSEFCDPSESNKNEVNQQRKKPTFMYVFSDGETSIKCIARDSVYGLDANTVLGSKLLIIPKLYCRYHAIKLDSTHCQFLGGCAERCMDENSPPLKSICLKLNLNPDEACLKAAKIKKQRAQTMVPTNILEPMTVSTKPLQTTLVQNHIALKTVPLKNQTMVPTNILEPTKISAKPLETTLDQNHIALGNAPLENQTMVPTNILEPFSVKPLEATLVQNHIVLGNVPLENQTMVRANILEPKKVSAKPLEAPLVQNYIALGIVPLMKIMNDKKFWMQPECHLIQPIVCHAEKSLTANESMLWILKVDVYTDNYPPVRMIADDDVLRSLLGFNVEYVKKVQAQKNQVELNRCFEAKNRIMKIFERLDILLFVEFSPDPSSTPIIKNINNLGKALNII